MDPLRAGWELLRDARWEEARAAFARAGDEASAHEGLSWAAWWLDDGPAVFAERERAYHLHRDAGDAAGAARMATWLAVDRLEFEGAAAVAAGWLRRAHRLLEDLEPGPDHGWLAFHEGYLAHAAGDTARAGELAADTIALGRRAGVVDLEMLGLALEGATLVRRAHVADGMRRLDEATALALEGGAAIPIASAWTCCLLVSACVSVQDYARAAEWCDRIHEFARSHGSRYMLAFCRAEYGAIDMWRGRWTAAEAMLDAAAEDFARARPAWVSGPLTGLAELRRRQGRGAEAVALLDRAGGSPRVLLCRAALVLDRGETLRAAELAERLLRQLPVERRLDRVPALELLAHARAARGELDEAAPALAALRDTERAVGTPALRACADRADAVLAAARGDHERARTLLEDAVDAFERCGAPYEAARARLELATSLVALGRLDVARHEAAAARDAFTALGAPGAAERARRILAAAEPRSGGLAHVTRREREVLQLLSDGLTNRQIAERLVVSEHTVHRHVSSLLRKLGVPSRTAAAAYAVRFGLAGRPSG
jgi:DNA-binding NarL/FixJ family response regulator